MSDEETVEETPEETPEQTPAETTPVVINFPIDPFDCPICDASVNEGFFINWIAEQYFLVCSCGLHSRTYSNLIDLIRWWNTRAGEQADYDETVAFDNPRHEEYEGEETREDPEGRF